MHIYIVVLIYIIILSIIMKQTKKPANSKVYLFLCFVPLTLIACLRNPSIGIDTQQFVNAFDKIIFLKPENFGLLRYEYGFSYLCWIIGKICTNSQLLIFVTSLFVNYSIARFISKNSENVYISVILYLIVNFYFSYMNIMRQALAISILLLGFEFLKEKKYVKYLLFVLIASFFHSSAILAVIFIFLRKFKFNRKFLITCCLITIVSFIFGEEFFIFLSKISPRLADYSNSSFTTENYFGSLLDFLVYALVFIFGIVILLKNDRCVFDDKDNKMNILIGIMGVATIFYVLVMKVIIFNRFTHYFSIFMIIWLPNCIMRIKNTKNRFYITTILTVFFILYWLIIMIYRPNWYGVIPYKFCF